MTVSEQIIQVIDALCSKLGIAIDWTSEHIIPYIEVLCEKLITYKIATSIVWIVIMALLSAGSIIAAKKLAPVFKRRIEESSCRDNDWYIGAAFAIIGLVIINLTVFIVVVVQVMNIIQCVTFPEMYIVEYINTLIQ